MFTLIFSLLTQTVVFTAYADDFLDRYPDCKVLEQKHCDQQFVMIGQRMACYRQVMTLANSCITRVKKQVKQGTADLKALETRRIGELKRKANEAVQKGYEKYTGKRLAATDEIVIEKTAATDQLRTYVGYLNRQIFPLYEQAMPRAERFVQEISKLNSATSLPDSMRSEYQRIDRDLERLIVNHGFYSAEFTPFFRALKYPENRSSFLALLEPLQRYSIQAQSVRDDLKQLVDQFQNDRKSFNPKAMNASKVSKLEILLQKMSQIQLLKGSQEDFDFYQRLCLTESGNEPKRCELGDRP